MAEPGVPLVTDLDEIVSRFGRRAMAPYATEADGSEEAEWAELRAVLLRGLPPADEALHRLGGAVLCVRFAWLPVSHHELSPGGGARVVTVARRMGVIGRLIDVPQGRGGEHLLATAADAHNLPALVAVATMGVEGWRLDDANLYPWADP